ncbi:MAG: hypothetical protein KGS72_17780 [Cyanobacteria bacterium REEB67]|nr:hypothetical protein [Cyanobacteria bacterium REEB67]
MNFDPASYEHTDHVPAMAAVEDTVIEAIVMGSGGPENIEITDGGLRFVRHLLANSRSIRFGFIPNMKDPDCIRQVAREFIRRCGSGPIALQTMYQVIQTAEA